MEEDSREATQNIKPANSLFTCTQQLSVNILQTFIKYKLVHPQPWFDLHTSHNSNCGIVRRQRGLREKTRVTPHHSPVHLY